MQKILNGVQQFQRTVFGTKRQLFEQLSRGQQPQALFITCSDSRVDPCLLTQTEPGELFILRNAGNIIPPYRYPLGAEAAAVEFAIRALRIRHIIVCGHSQAARWRAFYSRRRPSRCRLREWLEHARATMNAIEAKSLLVADNTSELLVQAVEQNVLVQLANLETHPVVADALSRNEVLLHGWVYEFETGKVTCCQHPNDQFMPLECVTAADSVIE